MKKIITLALAAVMTLGLVTLPKAETNKEKFEKEQQENYNKALETEKAKLNKAIEDAKVKVNAAKVELDNKNKALAAAEKDDQKTQADIKAAKEAVATAEKALKDANAEYDAAVKAYSEFVGETPKFPRTVLDNANAKEYGYVFLKIADTDFGKDHYEGFVKAGAYTIESLVKAFGLDPDMFAADDEQAGLVEVKPLTTTTVTLRVVKKHRLHIRAVSEDGLLLGYYNVNAKVMAKRGWVIPGEVAAKALVNKDDNGNLLQLVPGVDGYWVLADVEANKTPQYFHKTTMGGNYEITAVYTTAKHKMWKGDKASDKAATKPGQVGKTGEVATVATGLGALMTLAGVVVATKRH